VPFNLPDVISASKVYIVEGEKCAEAVISAGRTATTFDSGSNFKWNNKFSEYFHEKEVVIIPDNDTPGLKYAKTIKDKLPKPSAERQLSVPRAYSRCSSKRITN